MNKLRREDIARVRSTIFKFQNKGLENQHMGLKSFLLEHPSCMASEFEMILSKLNIFGLLIAMKKMAVVESEAEKDRAKSKKQKRIKYEKPKPKPEVIEIEEEDEEEPEPEESEPEYEEVKEEEKDETE